MAQQTSSYLKDCVIEATANDYENVATIASDVENWAKSDGQQFSQEQLAQAIESLVEERKLHVFKYSKELSKYVEAPFSRKAIDQLWFSSKN
jgi:hypothetical protein